MGGCLLNDNLGGEESFQLVAQPPDPELAVRSGARSGKSDSRPRIPPLRWLQHPLRDAYCGRLGVRGYAAIECPVYAVGGWADGYTNAIPRLLAGLSAPRSGWSGLGPRPPTRACPAPPSASPGRSRLVESLPARRARSERSSDPPCYRVWMPESVPAGSDGGDRPGRWVAESRWPSPRIEPRVLHLASHRLGVPARPRDSRSARPRRPVAPLALAGGGVRDQRDDDAVSLCFDANRRAAHRDARRTRAPARRVVGPTVRVRGGAPVRRRARRLLDARQLRAGNLTHAPTTRRGHARAGPAAKSLPAERCRARIPAGHRFGSRSRTRTGRWSGRRPFRRVADLHRGVSTGLAGPPADPDDAHCPPSILRARPAQRVEAAR